MANANKVCDVLISHSASDAALAGEVATACRANNLEAITSFELQPEDNASEALWEALAESRALLTVLPSAGPTPSMAIEIGAARAWNKPIFAILTDPSFRPPPALSGIYLYDASRIDDVIRAIKRSTQELTNEERTSLAGIYTEFGVSVDELALDPRSLGELVKRFETETRRSVPGEALLSELLRMRKQGKLAKFRSARRTKRRSRSA